MRPSSSTGRKVKESWTIGSGLSRCASGWATVAAPRWAVVFKERDEILMSFVTERFERRLTEECAKLRSEMVQLRADLRVDIANARADFIKWSFLFWIGQAATVAGLLVALN